MFHLEATFDFQKLTAADVWKELLESFPKIRSGGGQVRSSGKQQSVERVLSNLKRSRAMTFRVSFGEGDLIYNCIRNKNISVLFLKAFVSSTQNTTPIMPGLLKSDPFIMARVYDKDYNFWQNAQQKLQYEAYDKSWHGLPLVSNGAPPPLDEMVIDISQNPGRSEFMDGYIEAIGHVMWLSPKFWKRTGSTLQSVLQTCPEATAHKCGVVDVLKFQDTPFTSAEGLEGDLQKRIRAALFPLEGGVPHVPLPYAILRESQPILYQEWLQLTEKDRDLEYQKDISATNPKTGEVITMQEEAVKWTVNSTLFRFEDGAILADDPTEATLKKMRDLASLLNASVIPVT